MPERTIEAADVPKVCFILLKLMEQDGQPITVLKDGQPYVIMTPIQKLDCAADPKR